MDGDVAPLDDLVDLCERHNAILVIDEAHSTGVFGKSGRGLTEQFCLEGKIPVVMGTLSKAIGSVGGFIAGKHVLKETLTNFCRPFIYTTAPSPSASAAALTALELITKDKTLRSRLWANVQFLRESLKEAGFDLMRSEGPIVPIRASHAAETLRFRDDLRKQGFIISAIRAPSVPRGTDRLRLSVSASHGFSQIRSLVRAMKKTRERLP
jgi:7-keto-8-aminopelargonate synthetase-like enzyme